MSDDDMRLFKDGLWNQDGWAEEYVLFMSKQDPEVIASELRTLLINCSMKELKQIRETYEDFYLDGLFLT
jgi:hypothetical protein